MIYGYIQLVCMEAAWFIQLHNSDIQWLRIINLQRIKELDGLFNCITYSASPIAFGIPLVLLMIGAFKHKKVLFSKSVYLMLSVMVASVVSTLIKYAVNRPRPFISYPDIEKVTAGGSPSFPSGHTTDAFVIAMALCIVFHKWQVRIPAFIWALAVGFSRISLGVHYPIDVISGALIGILAAIVCFRVVSPKLNHLSHDNFSGN